MHRVLLTGAGGFVGRHCLPDLVATGAEVHGITRRSRTFADDLPVMWHRVDLFDPVQTEELVRHVRPTHLVHAAWFLDPASYRESVLNYQWVEASLRLVQLFAENGGQRAVMVGTCFEYDLTYGFCSENRTPLGADSAYGRCKAALSTLFEGLCESTDLMSGVWARPFFIYGPHEPLTRLVPAVASACLENRPAHCSHGNQIRDYLHVADVAAALVALTFSDVTGAVNVSSGIPVRLRDIVLGVARRLGGEDLVRFGAIPTPPDEPPLIVGDSRKLCDTVGWMPRYDLDTGLDQVTAWWRENHAQLERK